MSELPASARWLLDRLRLGERRAEIEADLAEVCRVARRTRGPLQARLRCWREIAGLLRWGIGRPPSAPREVRMDGFVHDIRYGLRSLRRSPGYTPIAVLTLALGIGAVTSMYSLVHGVVLTPLPLPSPERLLMVSETTPQGRPTAASAANYVDWAGENETFSGLALVSGWGPMLSGDEPLLLSGARVTANFLDVLGLEPVIGRDFRPGEDQPGADPVVILSHGFWRERFAGDPEVVGEQLLLDGSPRTIVGVAPAELARVGYAVQVLAPVILLEGTWLEYRGRHNVNVIGRLRDGVDRDVAQEQMSAVAERLAVAYPETNDGYGILLRSLDEIMIGDAARPLWLLLAAVGFVLLIACFNIANLTLARGFGRRDELAVYAALGAPRRRLLRRLLIENGCVAVLGGALGVSAAWVGLDMLLRLTPGSLPRREEVALAPEVLAFATLVTVATVVVVGLLPALRSSRAADQRVDSFRRICSGRGDNALRAALMVFETAVMIVLLVGAGLFLRSLAFLGSVDVGIEVDGVRTANVYLPRSAYEEGARSRQAVEELSGALGADPRVRAAATISTAPLSSQGMTFSFSIEGGEEHGPRGPQTGFRIVSPSYFETVGVRRVGGRGFDSADRVGSAPVVVINEELAGRYWPAGDAIGKRISFREDDDDERIWEEIVGVVSNVRQLGPGAPPLPIVYQSALQADETWGWTGRHLSVLARSNGSDAATAEALRAHIRAVVPEAPILAEGSLADGLSRSTGSARFLALVLGLFGGLAAVLAGVGFYGVLSFAVGRRSREFGLRIALGARPAELVRSVVGSGLKLFAAGATLGTIAALLLLRLVEGLLHGAGPFDPATYGAALTVGMALAMLASWLPARRAARADPAVVLRDA